MGDSSQAPTLALKQPFAALAAPMWTAAAGEVGYVHPLWPLAHTAHELALLLQSPEGMLEYEVGICRDALKNMKVMIVAMLSPLLRRLEHDCQAARAADPLHSHGIALDSRVLCVNGDHALTPTEVIWLHLSKLEEMNALLAANNLWLAVRCVAESPLPRPVFTIGLRCDLADSLADDKRVLMA